MPKVQHLSTNSYESVMVDALFKTFKGKSTELEYSHVVCTKQEIPSLIDDTCTVLVLTGFSINHLEDTALLNKLYYEYNVPFAEVLLIGAMTEHSAMPSFTSFLGNETQSAVEQFYNYVCEGYSTFIEELGTRGLQRVVNSYTAYNLYTFPTTGDMAPLHQYLLYESFGFHLGDTLKENGYHNFMDNPTLERIVVKAMTDMSSYIKRHTRWVEWAVVQDYSGDFVTIGAITAEAHKNELAHSLLAMSNTPKAIVVIIEDKGYTQLTIRTTNYDAVEVGKAIDPNSSGKYNACTVFTSLPRVARNIVGALESQLRIIT